MNANIESTMPSDPVPFPGVNASEMDCTLSRLQVLADVLLKERDELRLRVNRLEAENVELRESLGFLREKWRNCQPIIQEFGNGLITPEEADRIMREDQWVEFDEVMREVRSAGE